MPDQGSTPRDDLAALRIERPDTAPRPSRRRLAVAAAAAAALVGAGVAARVLLVSDAVVEVAYATRTRSAEPARGGAVLSGSGYVVTADRYVSLGTRVPGRIEAYLVEEGESVGAGQALVRLDARPFEAQLRRAEADLALARADADLRQKELRRLRALRERDVSSQAELDVKENELRVAEARIARHRAEIEQIRLDLADTVLRAPSDGVVLEKFKEVGEIATPGGFAGSGELIRLANLDELRAEVDVNETDLAKVRLGQPAEVVPDAYTDRRYRAEVVKLAAQVDRQKGTLEVEVRILEPDAWLRPDMSARVVFLAEAPDTAGGRPLVLAPPAALRSDAGGTFVWVVTGGRLRRQAIETRGRVGDRVVVVSGLDGGERLVVGGAGELRAGQRVEPVDAG